jgi:hypothetical protein
MTAASPVIVGCAIMLAGGGCAPVLRAETTSENPSAVGARTLPIIITRPRMQEQKAVYDRLDVSANRFKAFAALGEIYAPNEIEMSVQIWHPWRDLADLRQYRVTLQVDNQAPAAAREVLGPEVVSFLERLETTTHRPIAVKNPNGSIAYFDAQGIGGIEKDLYRGRATFRFHGEPVFTSKARQLTLALHHPRQGYVFTWRFVPLSGSGQATGTVNPLALPPTEARPRPPPAQPPPEGSATPPPLPTPAEPAPPAGEETPPGSAPAAPP